MKANLLKFPPLLLLVQICNADKIDSVNIHSEYIEALKLNYSVDNFCIPETDNCNTIVTLTSEGKSAIKISGLEGPIILSVVNSQILSCEANDIIETTEAKLFNLQGALVSRIPHRGYLQQCDITTDDKLYWFHYNKVVNSNPVNVLVVVSVTGKVVMEQEINHGGSIGFKYDGKDYSVKI